MSLTISITKKNEPVPFDESKSVTFSAGDGYWEYMEPWFREFNAKCSESLDLYEYGKISPENLSELAKVLSAGHTATQRGPDSVRIFLGTQTYMGRTEEVHKEIPRKDLLAFIHKMLSLTNEAIQSKETLAILGD